MSDTVQCLTCATFTLKDVSSEWLRMGFGNCGHREKFIVFGARRDRDCGKHEKAGPDTIKKRDALLRELNQ